MNKKRFFIIILMAVALITSLVEFGKSKKTIAQPYIVNNGYIQGTTYNISYQNPKGVDLNDSIYAIMKRFDKSLSTYDTTSIISRINHNQSDVILDAFFTEMFFKSEEYYKLSDGAFDITVGGLVNYWGFGPKSKRNNLSAVDDNAIQALKNHTGFSKVSIQNNRVIKLDTLIILDAGAIAQGYLVDVVATYLTKEGIANYLVEIGGEVIAKGLNSKGKKWTIGIDKPLFNTSGAERELQAIIEVSGKAVSTSGSYRAFFEKDGRKYSHTIDPKTGYPVNHNLLSATVIADKCIDTDALATCCMVFGVEKSLALAAKQKNFELMLIFEDANGQLETVNTPGFESYILE